MSAAIDPQLLARLSELVSERMGLHFPQSRWPDLQRGMQSACTEWGFAGLAECAQSLLSSPATRQQIETLASHLTVGETYFFREKPAFEFLQNRVLPELILARRGRGRPLRIWSAGSSTGEEAYSIAMAIRQLWPSASDQDVMILATDINPGFLGKAMEGVYGDWSFRDMPADLKEHYFKTTPKSRHAIRDEVRSLVDFAYLNLADDTYPSPLNNTNAMDLIFCRNVLIYLESGQAQRMVHRLSQSLSNGGWLFVGATETSSVQHPDLEIIQTAGAIAYRKRSVQSVKTDAQAILPSWSAPVWVEPVPLPTVASIPTVAKPPSPIPPPAKKTASLELARDLANAGKLSEALEECQNAIAANKLDPALPYLQAGILQEQGELAGAAEALRRTIYLDPDFVMAHFALGHLARRRGRIDNADRHLKHAARLLSRYGVDDILPESEGITAGRLAEIILLWSSRKAVG